VTGFPQPNAIVTDAFGGHYFVDAALAKVVGVNAVASKATIPSTSNMPGAIVC
jgi:hypothetical protein